MEIKELINNFLKNQTNENFSDVIEALIDTNVILVSSKLTGDLKKFGDNGVTPLIMSDSEKKNYIPLFTSNDEITAENIIVVSHLSNKYLYSTESFGISLSQIYSHGLPLL